MSVLIEGNLEAKLPTIWTDGKTQPGRSSDMEKVRSEKIRDGESQKREKKKLQMREIGKSRKAVFFQCFVALEGRKSRLAKAAGA